MPWCTSFSLVCTILSFHYFLRSFTWLGSGHLIFLWFNKCLGLLLGLESFCYHTNNEWSSWQLIMLGWSDVLRKFGVCEEAWGFGLQTPISSLCNLFCLISFPIFSLLLLFFLDFPSQQSIGVAVLLLASRTGNILPLDGEATEKVNAIKRTPKYYIIVLGLTASVRRKNTSAIKTRGNLIKLKRIEWQIYHFNKGPFVVDVFSS